MSYVLFAIAGIVIGAFVRALFASMRVQRLQERLRAKELPKRKRQMEFFKIIVLLTVLYANSIVLVMVILNFVLIWNYKESMSQETIQAIATYGGIAQAAVSASYAGLQGWRNYSANKEKVTETLLEHEREKEGGRG